MLSAFPARGHNGAHLDEAQRQLIISAYDKASALDPEIFHSPRPALSQAYTVSGGQKALDSSFHNWVRGWIRLFHHEIEHDCPINESELIKSVEAHIPRSWFYFYRKKIMDRFYEHALIQASDLGAKFGMTVFYLKISLEVMETILSFVIGGLGIHIACNAVDVLVFFIVRKLQTYGQVFHSGKILNQNRALMIARLAWMRHKQKKAEGRIRFRLTSALIHPEGLESVNKEGRKNNRRKWLEKLSSKVSPILTEIQEIEARLEDQNLSEKEKQKLSAKRHKLYQRAGRLTEVSRKDFFGERYKRYFWIRSRKGKETHLDGHTVTDQAVSHKGIWSAGVEENIFERAFRPLLEYTEESEAEITHPSITEEISALVKSAEAFQEQGALTDIEGSFFHRMEQAVTEESETFRHPSQRPDEIRRELAEEFSKKVRKEMQVTNTEKHIKAVEYVLGDIEKIFDPSVSMKERHNLAFEMEMILTGFFSYYLKMIFEELLPKKSSLRNQMAVRWKLSLFLRHSYIYADSLFAVSLIKNPSVLASYKYEAMENLLTLLEYLNKLSRITQGERQEPSILLARLDQNLHPLQTSPFLGEKRSVFSLLPLRSPHPPTCHDLMRKEN